MSITDRALREIEETKAIAKRFDVIANEDSLALIFAEKFKDELRYDHTVGKWYRFNGSYWQVEATLAALDYARSLIREFNKSHDKTLPKYRTAHAVEMFARSDRRLATTYENWDRDPWLLCTPTGLVNLRTGIFTENAASYGITKCTTVGRSDQKTPIYKQFLDEITQGDQSFQRYLQQIAGYCLTGDIREHALFFVYGGGGNGKSVFVNVLKDILGSYAQTAAMETFTATKYDRHPTELARLVAARFVTASETESGRAWAESRIKQLTGGDPVAARYMRQDFFEYMPQFKLVFIGNHAPILSSVDQAERRRFQIIPFNFKPKTPDKALPQKLKQEYGGILQWMINGCLDWQRHGLIVPEIVRQETQNYFSEQDLFSQWLCECTKKSVLGGEPTARLFASWSNWAKSNGQDPGKNTTLVEKLIRAGYVSTKHTPGHHEKRGFKGIQLILLPEQAGSRYEK